MVHCNQDPSAAGTTLGLKSGSGYVFWITSIDATDKR